MGRGQSQYLAVANSFESSSRRKALLIDVGDSQLLLTPHAQERYWDRVKARIQDQDQASKDLERLIIDFGSIVSTPPEWHAPQASKHVTTHWLVIGELDFIFPLAQESTRFHALTCLTRGGLSQMARERRNKRRKKHMNRDTMPHYGKGERNYRGYWDDTF